MLETKLLLIILQIKKRFENSDFGGGKMKVKNEVSLMELLKETKFL